MGRGLRIVARAKRVEREVKFRGKALDQFLISHSPSKRILTSVIERVQVLDPASVPHRKRDTQRRGLPHILDTIFFLEKEKVQGEEEGGEEVYGQIDIARDMDKLHRRGGACLGAGGRRYYRGEEELRSGEDEHPVYRRDYRGHLGMGRDLKRLVWYRGKVSTHR
jgi:hypothetical protein